MLLESWWMENPLFVAGEATTTITARTNAFLMTWQRGNGYLTPASQNPGNLMKPHYIYQVNMLGN